MNNIKLNMVIIGLRSSEVENEVRKKAIRSWVRRMRKREKKGGIR